MERIILFISCFVGIYLLYLITVILQSKKMDKFQNGKQVQFFVKKYGLKFNNISINKFTHLLAITNSLIMSVTILIISYIPNLMVKLLLAFFLLISLILIGYSILGNYIIKKEGSKNV